jgi:16S rRNA (adenine1518-N6/adenine1519-N6)-dimethyltransferase
MSVFSTAPLPLREVIAQFNLRADKSLGQHFLLEPGLLGRIAAAAGDLTGLHVVEVGPGPGGLTRALLETPAAHVTAIEYDPRAVAAITALAAVCPRLTVIQGDAMQTDIPALFPGPRAIVANLPYNIGTPLLVRWLHEAAAYQSLTLMFQQEVAERISAPPDTGPYGRISVLSQWLCDVALQMHIPASAFAPPPKVDSALVRLVPHAVRLTAAAFGQRRKMLRGALKGLGGEALLEMAGIEPTRRAETLTIGEFERLMRKLLEREAQK